MDDLVAWAAVLGDRASDRLSEPLRICAVCVTGLGLSGGGISMVTPVGHRGVVCATDDVSARIEELQLTLGEGPCIEAVRGGVPVVIPDVDQRDGASADRWPAFIDGAAEAGARAIFAFPLLVGSVNVGALDLYRAQPGDLSANQMAGALMAADAAALSLVQLDATADETFSDDPTARSSYHMQVHQAAGMVSVQVGVSVDDALLVLRARAFATDHTVVDVARDVVERRLRFPAEER